MTVENLSYNEAKEMALETLEIKGHTCFLVDLGEHLGYSILVYKNFKHIHYANDYQLHHEWLVKNKGLDALRESYIQSMNCSLFTEEELMGPLHSYDEYTKKVHYLHNFWIMQYEYTSLFAISEKDQRILEEKVKTMPYYCPTCFCNVADPKIIPVAAKMKEHLDAEFETLKKRKDHFRQMVSYELANHEACITCDSDEALASLGLSWSELTLEQQQIVSEELNKQIHQYACDD